MRAERWWTWYWDRRTYHDVEVNYTSITRWRRGWVSLYRFVGYGVVEWRLYLPFNISVGIEMAP